MIKINSGGTVTQNIDNATLSYALWNGGIVANGGQTAYDANGNSEGWSKDMALFLARIAAHAISSNGTNNTKALYTSLGYDLAATGWNPTCR